MPIGTTYGNAVLDYLCRGTAMPAAPTAVHVSLHTADPGATGASEMAGGQTHVVTNTITTNAGRIRTGSIAIRCVAAR